MKAEEKSLKKSKCVMCKGDMYGDEFGDCCSIGCRFRRNGQISQMKVGAIGEKPHICGGDWWVDFNSYDMFRDK